VSVALVTLAAVALGGVRLVIGDGQWSWAALTVGEPPPPAPKLPGRVVGEVGVASFNAYRHLEYPDAKADWDRITGNDQVDLIGWQESRSPAFRTLYPRYRDRGWETWHYPDADGPISLAISWRPEVLTLEKIRWWRMHRGGYPSQTDSPFPARWVVAATFRHRASGLLLTLLNTHVNQHTEDGDQFRHNLNARRARIHLAKLSRLWQTVPGDVVLGTGDYNFDYADDSSARPRGGISRRFEGRAVSSYDALGLDGVPPTHDSRWIDYVFLAHQSVRGTDGSGGLAQFVLHRSLSGFSSDHSPLYARIRLYAPTR
jgi:hypothetical protein